MASYVFMRVLESSARRYDRGMRLLSRGRIHRVYETVAERVASPGRRVLDIGCGTGAVALACAARGADVTAIDINAEMLEVARSKEVVSLRGGTVEWLELGLAEIEDRFGPDSFDGVTACLLLSELSDDERSYLLAIASSRLAPGGDLVLADEVVPASWPARLLYHLGRLPQAIAASLVAQTTTRPVADLVEQVVDAGFVDVTEERVLADFTVVHGYRPLEAA
jgi:demethylmenaquinone methyltransferase/2-methoxy-6-polyprenyl-1,4-benzoquinol methylase